MVKAQSSIERLWNKHSDVYENFHSVNVISDRTYVFRGTRAQREFERLQALGRVFDPATRRCLIATGLGHGWNCLEVGAGAGSIAKWILGIKETVQCVTT
jgi:hypothetical protein